MVRVLPYLAVLLLFSSYSEAYEAQYQVGATGPNGGVVTSVDVTTTLTDTQTEVISGFQETTEFYEHTETVIERIESTETITVLETVQTEVVTPTTTGNTLCPTCNVAGGGTGGVSINPDGYVYSYTGGTVAHTVGLSEYMSQSEFNAGFEINASVDTLTCLNTIGSNTSCDDVGNPTADTLSLTLTVSDGLETYTNTSTYSIDWSPASGFDTVYGYLDVPENNLQDYATATLSVYGIDNGYWGGYYGPYVTNPTMNFTYDAVSVVLQEIERQVTQVTVDYITTNLLSDSSIFTSEYVGDPTMDTVATPQITVDDIDVQIEPVGSGTFQATVTATDPATGEQQVQVLEVEVADLEIKELESFDEQDSGSVSEAGPNEGSEGNSEGGSSSGSGGNKSGSGRNGGGSFNPVLESVRVALMAQSEATQNFAAYQQKQLPSVAFYEPVALDGGVNYDNPTGRWMTGASEVMWDNMVDSQWQN
jgi:uncharacterized membrane protein YgcG